MNVTIQTVKFDADQKLIAFINAKFEKLTRFDDTIIDSEVILKLDKDVENGNKVVTFKVNVPGEDMVAEKRAHTFEEAVDLCLEALKNQISKRKRA
ncbi:MAG: HPF/RaiA family ribosome-associated protein [Rikenellaceae bacterium]